MSRPSVVRLSAVNMSSILIITLSLDNYVINIWQDDVLMHLTNYAITKHSSDFIRDDEKGHKRYVTN